MRRSDDADAPYLTKEAWEGLRRSLLIRCGGRCEACGATLDPNRWVAHHRVRKGMGGSQRAGMNALSNLLALAEHAHRWVHDHPNISATKGWIIPHAGEDVVALSGSTPLVLFSGRRVLLDPLWPGYLPAPGGPYDLSAHPFR